MKKKHEWRLCNAYAFKKSVKIMKWSMLFFFLGIIQAFAVDETYAQKTRLALDFSQAKLENVLNEIENQTEFYFLFNQDVINTDRKVDISVHDGKINEVLDML